MQPAIARTVKFKRIATLFVVEDVVNTAEYYRDVLGFELLGYFADPPVYAMVSRGAAEMHFGTADGEVQRPTCDKRKMSFDAYIWVDDIQELYEEMTAAGANITEGPVKRIYESTEVVIEDCNGFTIVFGD